MRAREMVRDGDEGGMMEEGGYWRRGRGRCGRIDVLMIWLNFEIWECFLKRGR
jgi:hypothetical protein